MVLLFVYYNLIHSVCLTRLTRLCHSYINSRLIGYWYAETRSWT